MNKKHFLLVSSLVLQLVAIPLSAYAQVIWVHRKLDLQTNDHLYTNNINEAPWYLLEGENYFGVAQNSPSSEWKPLERYLDIGINPAQHLCKSDYFLDGPDPNDSKNFEGILGWFYPHETYLTCSLAGFYPYCSPNCNKFQCTPPPGLRTLYRLDYYTYDQVEPGIRQNVRAQHYLLTTSKEERDQLLKSKETGEGNWGCSGETAGFLDGGGFFPGNPSPADCVLGFVY